MTWFRKPAAARQPAAPADRSAGAAPPRRRLIARAHRGGFGRPSRGFGDAYAPMTASDIIFRYGAAWLGRLGASVLVAALKAGPIARPARGARRPARPDGGQCRRRGRCIRSSSLSGANAAQPGRTHDRTQLGAAPSRLSLAPQGPSTHDKGRSAIAGRCDRHPPCRHRPVRLLCRAAAPRLTAQGERPRADDYFRDHRPTKGDRDGGPEQPPSPTLS